MNTIIKSINCNDINQDALNEAGCILRSGGLVAFPTETVYGLGGNALDEGASAKIYAAKGRPSDNPLIVHIADMISLQQLVKVIPPKADILMKKFWPGPLTLIFHKSEVVPFATTGGLDTVAVRMPVHPVALALIEAAGVCIAAPSANTSGRPSPTSAHHVIEDMQGKIPMIIDGGDVGIGLESTIVDMTCEPPMILRPGFITKEMLEEEVGEVSIDQAVLSAVSTDMKPKAPGMKYRHYAPDAELTIIEGPISEVMKRINQLTAEKILQGIRVGIIATDETKGNYHEGIVLSIGTRRDEETIARNLYGVLRKFDEIKVDCIFAEAFSEGHLGQAIMNRLTKAAGHHILKV